MTVSRTVGGYLVKSGCGREWFVPCAAVRRDYAKFLVDSDHISKAAARAAADAMRDDEVDAWFSDQFTWGDVEHYGELVRERSMAQTMRILKAALIQARGDIEERPDSWKFTHRVPRVR